MSSTAAAECEDSVGAAEAAKELALGLRFRGFRRSHIALQELRRIAAQKRQRPATPGVVWITLNRVRRIGSAT